MMWSEDVRTMEQLVAYCRYLLVAKRLVATTEGSHPC